MFLFKKTMFALATASLFIFAGCSSSDDLNVKVAEIDATIDGVSFNHKAVALLDYLVSENTGNLSANDFGSVDANVTYYDGKDYWFSTFCTITISGQSNGVALSLINGTSNCNVYKKGDENQKKAVSGTIYNVIGI